MAFTIKYLKDYKEIGSTPWNGTLEKTVETAKDGLIRHDAEIAVIFDDDGKEAARVKR